MDIFKKLESGEAVDMYTPEYRSVVEELHRIYKALHRLNAAGAVVIKDVSANSIVGGNPVKVTWILDSDEV